MSVWCVSTFSLASVVSTSNEPEKARDALEVCSSIEGVTVFSHNEVQGVTTLVQEACEKVEVMADYTMPKSLTVQSDIQNLTDYFARPRVVSRGVLNYSNYNSVYNSGVINSATLFNGVNAWFATGYERLRGVHGVRFSLVFTLQVAVTPFTQGVLAMGFQYVSPNAWDRTTNGAAITNLPHVRLDFSQGTMAQLKVPWFSLLDYLPISSSVPGLQAQPFGTLGVMPLMVLRQTVGTSTGTYRVMVHIEDLELVSAAPQEITNTILQAGKVARTEFETDAKPFSSALSYAGKTLSMISKGIPSISSIAGPASWAFDKAAGLARYFGYAKPQIQEPPMRVLHNFTAAEFNVDAPSATYTVAPFACSSLAFTRSFGHTDVDEMAFDYILSRWGQMRVVAFDTSSAANSFIWVSPVCPGAFWYRNTQTAMPQCNYLFPNISTATTNSILPTHLMNLASVFRYWRGDLEFRFTFSKTKFHSGRVMVTFTPLDTASFGVAVGTNIGVPNVALSAIQPTGYSAIFDLKDDNVFHFVVPYTYPWHWCDFNVAAGSISMAVFDPIQCPANVSTALDVLVEVRAGSNFQLSNVVGPLAPPHTSPTILQSGALMPTSTEADSPSTVSDILTSVKQLIMIPKQTFVSVATGINRYTLMPWFYQPTVSSAVPGPATFSAESFGLPGFFAGCYLFARGGTDYHAYAGSALSGNNSIFTLGYSSLVGNTSNNGPFGATGVDRPRLISEKSLHARVPAYQPSCKQYASVYNGISWNFSNPNFTITPAPSVPDFYPFLTVNADVPGNIYVSRAAADDAVLAGYIGPNPWALRASNTTINDPDSVVNIFQSGNEIPFIVLTSEPVFNLPQDHFSLPKPRFISPFESKDSNKEEVKVPEPTAPLPPAPPLRRTSRAMTSEQLGSLTTLLQSLPPLVNTAVETIETVSETLK